jgi:hypothetical protein
MKSLTPVGIVVIGASASGGGGGGGTASSNGTNADIDDWGNSGSGSGIVGSSGLVVPREGGNEPGRWEWRQFVRTLEIGTRALRTPVHDPES